MNLVPAAIIVIFLGTKPLILLFGGIAVIFLWIFDVFNEEVEIIEINFNADLKDLIE